MTTFNELYREHAVGLRAFLRRRLRSHEAAEDLTQETFVRAIEAEGNLRDRSKMRSYLYRIAHNLSLNQLRRKPVVRGEGDFDQEMDWEAIPQRSAISPSAEVEERELQETLMTLLAQLPLDQQRAFRWAVLEDRSYAEIGEITGWTAEKVKISVFRARKKLMKGLEDDRAPARDEGAA